MWPIKHSCHKALLYNLYSLQLLATAFSFNDLCLRIVTYNEYILKKSMLLSHFSRVRLCDPIDGSPPGSSVPGILQARTPEWVAISFSNAWKWSHSVMSNSSGSHGLQPTRLLRPWDFPGKSTGVGCPCLLQRKVYNHTYNMQDLF